MRSKFSKTEVNSKFRITSLRWVDPKSDDYLDLTNTTEDDITDMIKSDKELDDQAKFTVSVEYFNRGSVVDDFKVKYVIKEAYIAITFEFKPSNISNLLNNSIQFQKGILFQRFLIAVDSFNSSSPLDQCQGMVS